MFKKCKYCLILLSKNAMIHLKCKMPVWRTFKGILKSLLETNWVLEMSQHSPSISFLRTDLQDVVFCVIASQPMTYYRWTHGVISISILRANFAPIFWCQKLQSRTVSREICAKHFGMKNARIKCWWNRPINNFIFNI